MEGSEDSAERRSVEELEVALLEAEFAARTAGNLGSLKRSQRIALSSSNIVHFVEYFRICTAFLEALRLLPPSEIDRLQITDYSWNPTKCPDSPRCTTRNNESNSYFYRRWSNWPVGSVPDKNSQS
jgi:hypothetical protein